MYEPVSHSLLNEILDALTPELRCPELRNFYTRLGANFYAIHSLFQHLYGQRDDFKTHIIQLVEVMARRYLERAEQLIENDHAREKDHNWFLSQEWVAMALYTDGFADNLQGLQARLPYLQELGVNMLHLMPMLKCPRGACDGGYAVSNFFAINQRYGSMVDLNQLAAELRARQMLLVLDVVVNHTSDQHQWAKKARKGEQRYQDYYYCFPDRDLPNMFEQTMPEIFPETSPGNFIWDETMGQWVMTVFNHYQWDLNYSNPAVFVEMIDILLFWANRGADVLRLDAVAFLWKKIGTNCQNQREAHLLLQLMKDCCQVTAPGVLFIAEAIVAPSEIIKYFGEDAVIAKECEIAYNATFMSLLWDAMATKNARLLNQGIQSLPNKLDRATWLNYVRCHDDIGLGFDDTDIQRVGYEPYAHRQFLIDYFTGAYEGSNARGQPFARNEKTGDARISGSLASLVGLETAIEQADDQAIDAAIRKILLLHAMILSFGGIPLLYYGDEIGTINDCSFRQDLEKANDNRWLHRPRIDWDKAEQRHRHGSVEQRIFEGLKKLIAIRKTIPAFADFNNRELLQLGNPHLFGFMRSHPQHQAEEVLVLANFDAEYQHLDLSDLGLRSTFRVQQLQDLVSGGSPAMFKEQLVVPPFGFYWLRNS